MIQPFRLLQPAVSGGQVQQQGGSGIRVGVVTVIGHDHVRLVIAIEIGCNGFAGVETANGWIFQHTVIPAVGPVAVAKPHLEMLPLD